MRDNDTIILENIYKDIANFEILNEISWDKYPEVAGKSHCISPEEMGKTLNAILARSNLPDKERAKLKRNKNFPIVHGKSLKSDEEGNVNVDDFIQKLTKRPSSIFSQNEKAEHSETEDVITYNTGIPAFKALLWDEDEKMFRVITTCPGAGNCVIGCFAMLGNYIRLPDVVMKYAQRFQFLMDDPVGYEKAAYAEALGFAAKAEGMEKWLEIRWNDSGDFFSKTYFDIAKNITNKITKRGFGVKSYIYTKTADILDLAEEAGFTVTFSTDASVRSREKIDPYKTKLGIRVPRILWKYLFITNPRGKGYPLDENGKPQFKDSDGREKLKDVIFNFYQDKKYAKEGLTRESLKLNDELPRIEDPQKYKYNVIVLPKGDSDIGAQRKDVKNSFMLEH